MNSDKLNKIKLALTKTSTITNTKIPNMYAKTQNKCSLRPYQKNALKAAIKHIDNPTCSYGLITMPTGSGKTIVIAKTVEEALDKGHQILIITPRRNLLKQLSKHITNHHGLMSSNLGNDNGENHRIIIGTFQTLINREIIYPTLIIIDECHLMPPDSSYSSLLNRFSNATVLGFTATPVRGDEPIVDLDIGWELIFNISILELIRQQHVVQPRSMSTHGLVVSSDSDSDCITEAIVPTLIESVTSNNRNKILVFCVNIEHAESVAKLLKSLGETCVYIAHSRQNQKIQKRQVENFKDAIERSWLINVSLITLGVDIPPVDTVAILRDITTYSLLVQIIGRGLRLFLDKTDCLIYDFGKGTQRFGFIDEPKFKSKTTREYQFHFKSCLHCDTLNNLGSKCCSHCQYGEFKSAQKLKSNAVSVQLLSKQHDFMKVESYEIEQVKSVFKVTYSFFGQGIKAIKHFKSNPKDKLQEMINRRVCVEIIDGMVNFI